MAGFSRASLGLVIALFVFPSVVLSETYYVGGSVEYDKFHWGQFIIDYMLWASDKTFHVGDVLGEY